MRPRTAPGSRFAGHSSRAAQSPSQTAPAAAPFPPHPLRFARLDHARFRAIQPFCRSAASSFLLWPETGVALRNERPARIAILDLAG